MVEKYAEISHEFHVFPFFVEKKIHMSDIQAPNMDTFHIVICNIKCKGANLQLPCIVSLRSSLPHGDASISVISRSNDQYGLVIYVYLNCPHSVLERRLTASQIL